MDANDPKDPGRVGRDRMGDPTRDVTDPLLDVTRPNEPMAGEMGGAAGTVRRGVAPEGSQGYAGPRRVMSASSLVGDDVRNSEGEDLGHIEDIMIDLRGGRIAYAVLSFGGFLGMGDKLFAVPWHALRLIEEEKVFVLEVDKDTLRNAPGFDKNNWPDMADPNWGSQIYNFYGQRGYDENR